MPDGVRLSDDQLEALKMAIKDVTGMSCANTSGGTETDSGTTSESSCNSLRAIIRRSSGTRLEDAVVEETKDDALSRGIADLERRRIEVSRKAMTAIVGKLNQGCTTRSISIMSESSDSDGLSMNSTVSSQNSLTEFGTGSTSSSALARRSSESVLNVPFSAGSISYNADRDNNNVEVCIGFYLDLSMPFLFRLRQVILVSFWAN